MISVILYGRNDGYGYNLHKRAAISLNCIAAVLDGAGDEIVFVDYNSPDSMPTFVEAIRDTLTAKAKRLIRVLRVRPAHHERFGKATHLACLEPISRNVALRRSNPSNRWILSTSTDAIFVPEGNRSLTAVAAEFDDGFYQLPRFEIPESLWETFDRMDPERTIFSIRDWGARFHLNDVVHVDGPTIYDRSGDFQLALRRDMFAIHGFDEGMLLGWHVDANLARRMQLLRGEVKSALPSLHAYHCDHTRQATVLHRRDRKENDTRRFLDEVAAPTLPGQQDTWGLADQDIEEIDISDMASRFYVRALQDVLPGANRPYSESRYAGLGANDLNYDPEHALPYMCDPLSTNPRHWGVSYAGCRRHTFELFCEMFEKMGFTGRISIPANFTWLSPLPEQTAKIDRLPLGEWLQSSHQFIFEFGLGSDDGQEPRKFDVPRDLTWKREDRRRLDLTAFVFHVMVQNERVILDAVQPSRRVIAVNTIVNAFDALIRDNLSFTFTPYSSRTRHGYVIREIALPVAKAKPGGERTLTGDEGAARLAKEVTLPIRSAENIPVAADEGQRLSRMCDVNDWESTDWSKWARLFSGGRAPRTVHARQRGVWERASMLDGLGKLGMYAGDKCFLVVAKVPDELAAALARRVPHVDVGDIPAMFAGYGEVFSTQGTTDFKQLGKYDVIVLPRVAFVTVSGMMGLATLLRHTTKLLNEGGVIAIAADAAVGDRHDALCIPAALVGENRLAALIRMHTNLEVLGSGQNSISPATLGYYGIQENSDDPSDDLVIRRGDALISSSVWFLRRRARAGTENWAKFAAALSEYQSGSIIGFLHKTIVGTRAPDGFHSSRDEPSGYWVYGPYFKLPSGSYCVTIDCVASNARTGDDSAVIVDAIIGPSNRRAIRTLSANDLAKGPVDVRFRVPLRLSSEGRSEETFEVRLQHTGGADLHLRDVTLTNMGNVPTLGLIRTVRSAAYSILKPVATRQD